MKNHKTKKRFKEINFIDFLHDCTGKEKKCQRKKTKVRLQRKSKKISEVESLENKLEKLVDRHFIDRAIKKFTNNFDIEELLVYSWVNNILTLKSELIKEAKNVVIKESVFFQKFWSKTISAPWHAYEYKFFYNNNISARPLSVKFAAVCLVILIFSIVINFNAPRASDKIIKVFDNAIYVFANHDLNNRLTSEPVITKHMLANYIIRNKDKLKLNVSESTKTLKLSAEEIRGRVAGAMENSLINSEKNNKNNTQIIQAIKNFCGAIADNQKRISLELNKRLAELVK